MNSSIVFVAVSDSMKVTAEKIIGQMGLSIPVLMSKPDSILYDITRFPDSETFISRWATAQTLREGGKNVVEIKVEFQDLIAPIQSLSSRGIKKIAVVTQSGLIADRDKDYQVSDVSLLLRSYRSVQEASRIVQALICAGVQGFVGSQAVVVSAKKLGVPVQFLNCGEDSIRHALEEAQIMTESLISERRQQLEAMQAIQGFSTELYDAIDQAFSAIQRLDQSSQELAEVSKGVADIACTAFEQMKNTDQILKVLTKITSETTLLGINGAIESARAGLQGRSFSVIAQEVRQLALRSAQSTEVIDLDLHQLKMCVEDVQKNAEICKSISESQALESQNATKMLESLSNIGQELIDYMNTHT